MTAGAWLEVVEPSATAKQVAAWGADSLLLGMRIPLDDPFVSRTRFSAGRDPRDELQCGLAGSYYNVANFLKTQERWRGRAASTSVEGRVLVDGDTFDSGPVAFRYREGPVDPVLGCAWRFGDHVMFASPFWMARPRWYRAIALDGAQPRLVTAIVEDGVREEGRGRVADTWRNASLVVLDDLDGPTLRALHERSKQLGGEIDPAFLATVCAGASTAKGAVESLDDVIVRFDGAVVSCSLSTRIIGDSGARLKRMLEILKRPVANEPADPTSLAGLVRALFPEEAARHDALVEEVPLLDADGWRARVPESA